MRCNRCNQPLSERDRFTYGCRCEDCWAYEMRVLYWQEAKPPGSYLFLSGGGGTTLVRQGKARRAAERVFDGITSSPASP